MNLFLRVLLSLIVVTIVIKSIVKMCLSHREWNGYVSLIVDRIHSCYRKFPLFHALGRLVVDRKAPKGLPILDNVEIVSDRVIRISGLNPGSHTLQGTNTYLIGRHKKKILVDSGEDITCNEYVKLLFDVLGDEYTIDKILLTHGHGDHQGGVKRIIEECHKRSLPIPEVYKCNIKDGNFPSLGFDCKHINDGDVFQVDAETTVCAIYTPGHTDDHVSFIVLEDCAMLSGDCILGCGTTVFDDLYHYMQSLHVMKEYLLENSSLYKEIGLSHPVDKIYPGHGPIIGDALSKIDEYISHRLLREKQTLSALQETYKNDQVIQVSSDNIGWVSTWELVTLVYGKLPFFVKTSAHWNLQHHLDKLEREKRVITRFPDMWRIRDINRMGSVVNANGVVCEDDFCDLMPK